MRADREFIKSRLLPLETYRPPEHVSAEHAPAAVLAGLIDRPEGFSVVLTLRTAHLRRHAGQIALPGGRADPGELPWETALREAWEEVGLDPGRVEIAGLSDPFWTRTGYLITPVVGFVEPDVDLKPNPDEVADVFEVPFAFLMDPANHERRYRDQPPGPPRWHWAITWKDRLIWGATAGMVRGLYDRLQAVHAREPDNGAS